TRALPLFLAEELFVGTSARTAFLLPWLKRGGFVLSARPWTREFLPDDTADVLVFLHVDARRAPWGLEVRLENPRDEAATVTFTHVFGFETAAADVLALYQTLNSRLTRLLNLEQRPAGDLCAPDATLLPGYMAVSEQALAVAMAAREPEQEGLL